MSEDFFLVSELNRLIKDVLNAGFPRTLWVCGEIQQYDRNKSKSHVFFELVEKDPASHDIIARIGVVIFAGKKDQIASVLRRSENAFELKDDIEVKFACRVDFYAPHGAVRLIIEDIDPTYTLGKLAQEKQKLIALLKEKGVFEKNKACELPLVPLRIGLVTSYDSAAYNDFCSELVKSRFAFLVYCRNTVMQGKNAERDVCQALSIFAARDDIDVIVITRGGGSLADLSCFDSQLIAEKIATLPIPMLSGIGHEINFTITDMAAHTYAKTPTAIAQFLVERVTGVIERLDTCFDRTVDGATVGLEQQNHRLKEIAFTVQQRTVAYVQEHHHRLVRLAENIAYLPLKRLEAAAARMDDLSVQLRKAGQGRIVNEEKRVAGYERLIEAVSPQRTLRRGFTITRSSKGKVVRRADEVSVKDRVVTQTADGEFMSEVLHKRHTSEKE